jgi:hypothetical protein
VFLLPLGGGTKKADLLSIAPTPRAENQMNPETDPFPQSERMVQRLGLQPGGLAASGRKLTRLSAESFHHFYLQIHHNLSFTAVQTTDQPVDLSPARNKPYTGSSKPSLDPLRDALFRFGRHSPARQFAQIQAQTRRSVMEEIDLLEIPPTPGTDHEMQSHLQSRYDCWRLLKGTRRES